MKQTSCFREKKYHDGNFELYHTVIAELSKELDQSTDWTFLALGRSGTKAHTAGPKYSLANFASGSFRVKWFSGHVDIVSDLAHSVTFDLFP